MERKFTVAHRYLNLAVTEHGPKCEVTFWIGGEPVYRFRVRLAVDAPDYYVAAELERFRGKELTVTVSGYRGADPYAKMSLNDRRTGHERIYHEELRPRFHYSAICGWLNDPNGLLYYRGKWLLFAQLNPFYRWCDNMHWIGAVSTDLFHWKDTGPVLYAQPAYQKFSGSGIVDTQNVTGFKEGEHDPILLFYTDAGEDFHQSLVYSTDGGVSWREYEHNPILPQIAPCNRDPKVIPAPDGSGYLMALYLSGNDYALFFSQDLLHWEQTCVLTMPGCMECPDIYEIALDGDETQKYMVFSCAGGQYLVGTLKNGTFTALTEVQQNYCAPFYTVYAPQSFYGAPDGRRVQIICSSNGTMLPGEAFGKFLTLPCELTLRTTQNGMKLFSNPVEELRGLETQVWQPGSFTLCGKHPVEQCEGFQYRVEFSVPAAYAGELLLHIFNLTVPYRGSDCSVEHRGHRFAAFPEEEFVHFDLVVDRCSAELFLNDGELYLTAVQPFDLAAAPLVLEASEPVEIKDLRIAAIDSVLPFSEV